MSRFILAGVTLIFIVLFSLHTFSLQTKPEKNIKISRTPTVSLPVSQKTKAIFVPYWTISGKTIEDTYDTYIYFGIEVNKEGIKTQETGYIRIDQFFSVTPSKGKKLLTIRMINTEVNKVVLDDTNLQQKIISQSIDIAKKKDFYGIVLDFEIAAFGFANITKIITDFETSFADAVKKEQLNFYATMYGDTFSRFRPFDVKTIAKNSDGIMIMAYDFHKANGNPGPNFPLKNNQQEGYDFETMIKDFLQYVPPEKITVIFGQYGYDWTVDNNGKSTGQATALSYNEIQQKFLDSCSFSQCIITRDTIAAETKISYRDDKNRSHIVWFEDMHSSEKKTAFLKSQGVTSIAYWAYSYF